MGSVPDDANSKGRRASTWIPVGLGGATAATGWAGYLLKLDAQTAAIFMVGTLALTGLIVWRLAPTIEILARRIRKAGDVEFGSPDES